MSQSVLVVENLCKKYRGFQVSEVSFSLDSGYIMGFIGKNGAGKTTVMKLIQGIVRKKRGRVLINGIDISKDTIAAKNKIGFIMENPFLDKLTLLENGKLFGTYYKEFELDKFMNYLQQFQLEPNMMLGSLSKGMTTKFQLAFALSHNAKLLILDEPTGGLDPIFRRDFLALLQEVAETEDVGILISTHITSDLDKIADYITLIDNGSLVLSKIKEELYDDYKLVKGSREVLNKIPKNLFVSIRKYPEGFHALTECANTIKKIVTDTDHIMFEEVSIEDIMYYISKAGREQF